MKKLITVEGVIAAALPANSMITSGGVSDYHIEVAQSRFLKPKIGQSLIAALEEGKYNTFFDSYIRVPLALYAVYVALPQMAMKIGSGGVAMAKPEYHATLNREQLKDLRRQFRKTADVLMREAVAHIAANSESYPEFVPEESVADKIAIGSGIIIV